MTNEVSRVTLVDYVARRMRSDIEDQGGVDGFCELLRVHPEKCLSDLARGAVDCVDLGGCLHHRVIPR
jgi:hypothetical protein